MPDAFACIVLGTKELSRTIKAASLYEFTQRFASKMTNSSGNRESTGTQVGECFPTKESLNSFDTHTSPTLEDSGAFLLFKTELN
jgi:hypothetical protein